MSPIAIYAGLISAADWGDISSYFLLFSGHLKHPCGIVLKVVWGAGDEADS